MKPKSVQIRRDGSIKVALESMNGNTSTIVLSRDEAVDLNVMLESAIATSAEIAK